MSTYFISFKHPTADAETRGPAHSAQDLLKTPSLSPSPSTVTVATAPGLQRSGTYVVKVHERTTHSRTEFPRANPPVSPAKSRRKQHKTPERARCDTFDTDVEDERPRRLKEVNFTPKDSSRLFNLRRDPSVVSLLNLFDDHGCLDSKAFDNEPSDPSPSSASASAPPHEGREARKRTGSTLRELLGEPEPAFMVNDTAEGDISWAERLLEYVLHAYTYRDDSN